MGSAHETWRRLVFLTEGPTDVDALATIITALLIKDYNYRMIRWGSWDNVACLNHAREVGLGIGHVAGTGRVLCFKRKRGGEKLVVVIGWPALRGLGGYSGALEALRFYMSSLYLADVEYPTVVVAVVDGDVLTNEQSDTKFHPGKTVLQKKVGRNDFVKYLVFPCRTVVCTNVCGDRLPALLEVLPLRESPRIQMSKSRTATYIMFSGLCNCKRACKTRKYEIEVFEARLVQLIRNNSKIRKCLRNAGKCKIGKRGVWLTGKSMKVLRQRYGEDIVAKLVKLLSHEFEEWCNNKDYFITLRCDWGCCPLAYVSPLQLLAYALGHKDTYSFVTTLGEVAAGTVIKALKECNMYESLKHIIDKLESL